MFSDDVRSPILVKRGELISVAAQGGGIRVRTTAKSLQEGSKGDLIPVESLQTKQRFDVRVAGFREATIFTASRENVAQQTAGSESATRPTSLNR
ncbi:MAG: flagella basal body P-ring formation protein FlgA [Pirellulales bacterium]